MPKLIKLPEAIPSMLTFHESDNWANAQVKAEGVVIVSLAEDPTQDMKWVRSDKNVIFELHDESKKTESGNMQLRVFRFLAHAGSGMLTFNYVNPWNNTTPGKSVEFTVTAQ